MFSLKPKAEPKDEKPNEYPQKLEIMAQEAEPAALELADERMKECVDEHRRQVEGFDFSCKRHGDFLTIFMTRKANEGNEWYPTKKEFSTTLNLAKVRAIDLVEGRAAEFRDTRWDFSGKSNLPGHLGWFSTGMGYFDPGPDRFYTVSICYERPASQREFCVLSEEGDAHRNRIGDSGYTISHRTNYPAAAIDDTIVLRGLKATIFAPAGQGQAVLDEILSEIGKAAPNKQIDA